MRDADDIIEVLTISFKCKKVSQPIIEMQKPLIKTETKGRPLEHISKPLHELHCSLPFLSTNDEACFTHFL